MRKVKICSHYCTFVSSHLTMFFFYNLFPKILVTDIDL